MSHTTTELKNEIEGGLAQLRTLRDEICLKLHLAGMEAKDQWRSLEPQVAEIERAAKDVSEASRAALAEIVKRLEKLGETLR